MRPLTELESLVLAQIWKEQPITAYALQKIFSLSPLGRYSKSKGAIYPTIERLEKRALITFQEGEHPDRPSKLLISTMEGEDEVRKWLFDLDPQEMLPDDPLRTKVMFLSVLRKRQKREWIDAVGELVDQQCTLLDDYREINEDPDRFMEFAHLNAKATVVQRISWLKKLREVVR